eukprot:GILK01009892.1.p1 GENE.GILK01009892.1~~GILK01009892.1.p1  ORF type:complete len:205 (+),score=5.62 GILK01009892.1:36-617(+)
MTKLTAFINVVLGLELLLAVVCFQQATEYTPFRLDKSVANIAYACGAACLIIAVIGLVAFRRRSGSSMKYIYLGGWAIETIVMLGGVVIVWSSLLIQYDVLCDQVCTSCEPERCTRYARNFFGSSAIFLFAVMLACTIHVYACIVRAQQEVRDHQAVPGLRSPLLTWWAPSAPQAHTNHTYMAPMPPVSAPLY